jgi:hypothetical protein
MFIALQVGFVVFLLSFDSFLRYVMLCVVCCVLLFMCLCLAVSHCVFLEF